MTVAYLIYVLAGKLLIFFGMKFAEDNEIGYKFIRNLLSCDLCWGFWVYGLLSFLVGEPLFVEYFYVPVLSQLVTGGFTSLLVHLVTLGWNVKFSVITIE